MVQIDSISKETANKIVNTLKDAIQHDITFMDTQGCIIACTDPARVGKIHGAAQEMLKNHQRTLVVLSDEFYEGTRSGINMSLNFHDKVVGIVGITGCPDAVEPYGEVIRRMTELMLLEDEHNRKMAQHRYNIERFLHQWVQENVPFSDEFMRCGLTLGIDCSILRRVIVAVPDMEPQEENGFSLSMSYSMKNKLKNALYRCCGEDFQNLWYFNGPVLVLLVRENNEQALCELLRHLQQEVQQQTGLFLRFGCDNAASAKADVREGYQRALEAIQKNHQRKSINFYKDIGIDQILRYVPKSVRQKYLSKVFVGQNNKQIEEWCSLIDAVVENNGSLNGIAQQLYIHKNTVQYRIKKLESISGYDCRLPRDILALYLARMLWKQKTEEELSI